MRRRDFINNAVAGSLLLLTGGRSAATQSRLAEARIEVLPDELIGRIAPEIYGHFAEHLGGVIYDGIWVGEASKIPHVGGVRQALVEAMKRIKPSVVRWPGGCFAAVPGRWSREVSSIQACPLRSGRSTSTSFPAARSSS